MKKSRKRLTAAMAILCCLSLLVGSFAFFTDRLTANTGATAGNMDLVWEDTSLATGSNNEFAIDQVWDNKSLVEDGVINPGDYFDLSYTLTNAGSKSMDVRQQLILTSDVPMTDAAEEYQLTIITVAGETAIKAKEVSATAEGGTQIVYDLNDITINGELETEDGAFTFADGAAYTVRLDFAKNAGNAFMGSNVAVSYKAQAKQHRNTNDSHWATWAEYETKYGQIGEVDSTPAVNIPVSATDSESNDLNASASEISGAEKADLLSKLEESGLVDSADNVDALIEVESDDFEDMATATFDVSEIAQEGDKVVILHFNEETQQWEYISEETVNADGEVTADFSNFSPVAFVVVKPDGTTEIIGGSGNGGATGGEEPDPNAVAFAVYSEDDTSLRFYKRAEVPVAGQEYNGLTATTVYYDIEDALDTPEWCYDGNCYSVTNVVVEDKIQPLRTDFWFMEFYNCTSMNLEKLDTSKSDGAQFMFALCSSLTELDLSSFDTSNMEVMGSMFEDCSALQELNLSSFDTSNVTDMVDMFYGCSSLTELDVSSFDTANVTSMREMFDDCSSLTELDVSSFNTSKVTNMGSMFRNCDGLTSLDVSSFNTAKVNDMEWMFSGCDGLTSLDLSSFDTSNVIDMYSMFAYCPALEELNLSSFDTSNVTNMHNMFRGCSSLTELDITSFNTVKVANMVDMFNACKNLESIYVSDLWSTASVESSNRMFNGCTKLIGAIAYDSSVNSEGQDVTYANTIDGYLTYKAAA